MKFYVNEFSHHRMPLGPFYLCCSTVTHGNDILVRCMRNVFRAVIYTSRLKGFIYKLIKELNFGVVRLKATGYVYDKSRFINALYSHKAHEVFSINIE